MRSSGSSLGSGEVHAARPVHIAISRTRPQERQHFFLRFLAFDGQNNVAPLRDEIQELVGACIVPPRHFLADQPVASALPNDLSNRGLKREAARQQRIDHRLRRFRIGLICHLFAGCLLQQPKIARLPHPSRFSMGGRGQR